jgi:hypothetical protein
MARKPAALARELLRNFPKGRRGSKRRRRKPAGEGRQKAQDGAVAKTTLEEAAAGNGDGSTTKPEKLKVAAEVDADELDDTGVDDEDDDGLDDEDDRDDVDGPDDDVADEVDRDDDRENEDHRDDEDDLDDDDDEDDEDDDLDDEDSSSEPHGAEAA